MAKGPVRESELIHLLDAIYEAAFEPARWEDAVSAAVRLHGCHAGKMGSINIEHGSSYELGLCGIDPAIHDVWKEEFADRDVWAQAGLEALSRDPVHRSFIGAQVLPVDDLHRAPVYQEILRQCEIEDIVLTVLAWSETTIGFLACYGGPSRQPFERREGELHDWIGRHAQRAFALGGLLRREQGHSRALLERLPCAAFVCESDGRIVLCNARAEGLLRRGRGLRARRGRLRAQHSTDRHPLERALDFATRSAAGESLAGGTTLRVRREVGRAPLAVQVDPIPPDGLGAEAFLEPFARPVALVLASDSEERTVLPEEALAAAFGLTPAEARLLAALCAGESLSDYADRHAVSRETARFHLKQLFAKTGARRQAELVRMGLESVARLTAEPVRPEDDD